MKIIINKEIKDIGKPGQIVEVSEGYARNFLFPRGLATEATPTAIKQHEERQRHEKIRLEKLKAQAIELKEKLEASSVKIFAKAGEGGKLYGTVTNKEIGQEIKGQLGIDIDKRKIELEEPIKSVGAHKVAAKLHPEVVAHLNILIAAQ